MEIVYYIVKYRLPAHLWLIFIIVLAINLLIDKKRKLIATLRSFLFSYIFVVVFVTLIDRVSTDVMKAELVPFWSWYEVIVNHSNALLQENFCNIVLFIPIGILFQLLYEISPWKSFAIGFIMSAVIEFLQLITRRGLFEWDDMIHNGCGCLIGCVLCEIIIRAVEFISEKCR